MPFRPCLHAWFMALPYRERVSNSLEFLLNAIPYRHQRTCPVATTGVVKDAPWHSPAKSGQCDATVSTKLLNTTATPYSGARCCRCTETHCRLQPCGLWLRSLSLDKPHRRRHARRSPQPVLSITRLIPSWLFVMWWWRAQKASGGEANTATPTLMRRGSKYVPTLVSR